MFTSTPPYQWFKEHGLPHSMNNALWLLIMPVCIGLALLFLIWRGLPPRLRTQKQTDANAVPMPSTPMMPIVPAQDLSYLADPYYDRFFGPDSWRDGLLKRGQTLVEQWTTRLDYPEKQRREHDSKNWLGEANEFARKHLTSEQINEFMLHHRIAVSGGKKYDFAMAITQAGTVPSSEDGNLAFEIFGKIKLLERSRSESAPTIDDELDRRDKIMLKCVDATASGKKMFWALLEGGADELTNNDDLAYIINQLVENGHKNQLDFIPSSTWLHVLKKARLSPKRPSNEVELYDFICHLANLRPHLSNKTPIELIDEALAEGEDIERFCEGLNDGNECQQRVNVWLENTKSLLRASATDYFAIFYEAMEKQYTGYLCPDPDPQHPKAVAAMSKWYADKERLEAWQMVRKCLGALRSIKSKLRATLPS